MKRNIFKLFLFVFTFIAVVSCENQNDEILMSQEDELFMTYDQESPESVVEYLNEKFAHLNGQFYTKDQFIAAGFTPAPSSNEDLDGIHLEDLISNLEALSSSEEYVGAAQGDDPNDDGYNGVLLAHWDPFTFCGEACNGGSPSGYESYSLGNFSLPFGPATYQGSWYGFLVIDWNNVREGQRISTVGADVTGFGPKLSYESTYDNAQVLTYDRNGKSALVQVDHSGVVLGELKIEIPFTGISETFYASQNLSRSRIINFRK